MATTLVTMAPSHFAEKARWALDRLGLRYEERCVAPGLHFAALRLVGGRSSPTLIAENGEVFADSTDILEHLDRHAPAHLRLYPDDPRLREQVLRFEDELDERFAFLVRDYFYSWALEELTTMRRLFFPRTLASHRAFLKATLPLIRFGMRRKLNLDGKSVAAFFDALLSVWTQLDERLVGREFVVGDAFTAADLTLASLGAHAVAETGFGGTTLPLEMWPAQERGRAERLRQTPTGQHVMRMYREYRR